MHASAILIRHLSRVLLLIFLTAGIPHAFAGKDRLRCQNCGKLIYGKYFQYQGNPYCGKACLSRVLPKCANCGKTCEGAHVLAEGSHFCSKTCAQARLIPRCQCCGEPMESGIKLETVEGTELYCEACNRSQPHCFVCARPGSHRKLKDGRFLCRRCGATAVTDQATTRMLFAAVRTTLAERFQFDEGYPIPVYLVATNDPHVSAKGESREFGLYRYQAQIQITRSRDGKIAVTFKNEQWDVRLLSSVPELRLKETIAHELAHDFMRRHWPYLRNQKVQEGFAEYVAACYNASQRHPELNRRIQTNPDPVYGDGFRETAARVKAGGLQALYAYFDQCNQEGYAALLKEHGL